MVPDRSDNAEQSLAYLTGEQVATMLQVSVKSVYRWAKDDVSMPVLRIGGTVRFPRAKLLRWLQAREQGPGRARRLRQPLPSPTQGVDSLENATATDAACSKLCGNGSRKRGQKAHA